MIIDLRLHRKIGEGVYADVFAMESKAYKLFKSGPEIPPRQTKVGRRRVFEAQCEAFRAAFNDPWLRNHVAAFYGPCVIEDVLDTEGISNKGRYLLDCCYGLELIFSEGGEHKITEVGVRENCEHVREAIRRFNQIGIDVHDSSVFEHADAERFKFIDIEMGDWY